MIMDLYVQFYFNIAFYYLSICFVVNNKKINGILHEVNEIVLYSLHNLIKIK